MIKRYKHKKHIYRPIKIKLGAKSGSNCCIQRQSSSSVHDYVLINRGELDILSQYILDHPHIETGGQLFGYWTFDGKPVVLFVLGPGPKAKHQNTFFLQDIDYLRNCATLLKRKYGLDHIGEWHSHHQLGLTSPSSHDANNISSNMRKLGYTKFLLCIGTCTDTNSMVNAYMFSSTKKEFDHIPWQVKDIDSPFRLLISNSEKGYFVAPKTSVANMINLYTTSTKTRIVKLEYDRTYWLRKEGNPRALKAIIDDLQRLFLNNRYTPTIDSDNQVHIEVSVGDVLSEDIHFSAKFPLAPPRIETSTGLIYDNPTQWMFDGDIIGSTVTYYKNFKQRYTL